MTSTTHLFRQIHPLQLKDGSATSTAFRPKSNDHSLLSVYDGDLVSAAEAWSHYTETLKLASFGTLGFTVEECNRESLTARPDPVENNPHHAVIDFLGLTEKEVTTKSKELKKKAVARGWLYVG